jgi:hypothetical protein
MWFNYRQVSLLLTVGYLDKNFYVNKLFEKIGTALACT